MGKKEECILYSGGANGAEYEFGVQAERFGIEEIHFTFEGSDIARTRGVRVLSREELRNGDVSLSYVSRLMNRTYSDAPRIRKVLQTIWYQVNAGQEVYVIGRILGVRDEPGGRGGTHDQEPAVYRNRHRVLRRERPAVDPGALRAFFRVRNRRACLLPPSG